MPSHLHMVTVVFLHVTDTESSNWSSQKKWFTSADSEGRHVIFGSEWLLSIHCVISRI